MKIGGVILGACCAVAASLISVHFFLDPEPEARTIESADGIVRIEGRVYKEANLSIVEEQTIASFPLSSMRYTVFPEDALFAPPFLQLSFLRESVHPALYFWNGDGGYWIPVSRQTYEDERVYFPVAQGGTYALGEYFSVEAPTFIDVLSELRAKVSENAVSYNVSLIATPKDGVPVLAASDLERGGCGGVPFAYEQALVAQDSRTVQVLVNDVLTETTFTLLMEIGITATGCPEDMPLQVIF